MITISTLCWFEESPENLTGGIRRWPRSDKDAALYLPTHDGENHPPVALSPSTSCLSLRLRCLLARRFLNDAIP
jgi:hypothetical protein